MSSIPDAVQLPEGLCEGIDDQYFESASGDYTDEEYSHESDLESISSPEWEQLQQDVDEGDEPASFDVDMEMEYIEAAGMTSYVFFVGDHLILIVTEVAEARESTDLASSAPTSSSSLLSGDKYGFVLVTDNIDKNIRRSYQRENRQTVSLHYCHSCAIQNRVDISGLSDEPPKSVEITVDTFLPNTDDLSKLLNDFEILVSRYV